MNFSKVTALFAMVACIALFGGIASTQTTSPVASAVKQMSVNGADLVYLEQGQGAQWCLCTEHFRITVFGKRSARQSRSSTGISR